MCDHRDSKVGTSYALVQPITSRRKANSTSVDRSSAVNMHPTARRAPSARIARNVGKALLLLSVAQLCPADGAAADGPARATPSYTPLDPGSVGTSVGCDLLGRDGIYFDGHCVTEESVEEVIDFGKDEFLELLECKDTDGSPVDHCLMLLVGTPKGKQFYYVIEDDKSACQPTAAVKTDPIGAADVPTVQGNPQAKQSKGRKARPRSRPRQPSTVEPPMAVTGSGEPVGGLRFAPGTIHIESVKLPTVEYECKFGFSTALRFKSESEVMSTRDLKSASGTMTTQIRSNSVWAEILRVISTYSEAESESGTVIATEMKVSDAYGNVLGHKRDEQTVPNTVTYSLKDNLYDLQMKQCENGRQGIVDTGKLGGDLATPFCRALTGNPLIYPSSGTAEVGLPKLANIQLELSPTGVCVGMSAATEDAASLLSRAYYKYCTDEVKRWLEEEIAKEEEAKEEEEHDPDPVPPIKGDQDPPPWPVDSPPIGGKWTGSECSAFDTWTVVELVDGYPDCNTTTFYRCGILEEDPMTSWVWIPQTIVMWGDCPF